MKNEKVPQSIDQYISGFPEEVQSILQNVRRTIQKAAPEALEVISYQMPTFRLNGNLVHFAAFKNHIGFYPTPSGVTAFENELRNYHHAKGSVQFPIDKPIPLDLISRIVQYRVDENKKLKKQK